MRGTGNTRRMSLAVCVITAALGNPASAAAVSLRSVLEQLVADGYPILYSSDLVRPELQVDVEEISLPALRAALPALGLVLHREAGFYVVGRLPTEARSEAAGAGPETDGPGDHLETLIVTGTRHRLSGVRVGSLSTLTAEELRLTPSLGGDAMRVTTRLPGMSSVGVSAKPQIRGGLQDEVLVRVDGVELFDAYHLADFQSFFSVVDDRTVDAVDVYTGAFPARYGNRMSGVMDISTRERQDQDRTELGLSAISVFANTSGRLSSDRTRYVASLRHGNLEHLAEAIDHPIGAPRYYDAYGQITHRAADGTSFSIGSLLTRDNVSAVDDVETADSNIDNGYLWARIEHDLSRALTSDTLVTVSWSDRDLMQQAPAEDEDETDAFLDHEQSVKKFSVRSDFRYQALRHLMEFGVDAEWARSKYDSRATVDRGDLGELLHGERFRSHDIEISRAGWSGGVYWSGEFALGSGIDLLPGVRWDLQDYEGSDATDHVSPRIGMRYRPVPTLILRLDAGRYHQPEAVYELPVADGVSTFAPPQRSDHFVAGLEWLAGDDWEFSLDVYRKDYSRTKRRFENLFNPFVMIPELEADRVALAPREARARGVDLQVRGHLTAGLSTVLRYSYMDAEDRFGGDWVSRRWSQRHTVNWILAWKRETFDLAAAITWHSGWRGATPPSQVPEDEILPVEDLLNNTELKDYVSVDISASRTWQFNRAALTLYADVTNVLDRRNVAGIDWDAGEEDGVFEFERSTDVLLPLIPSVGIVIVF